MTAEEQIARARATRARRDKYWTLADIPLLVAYCITVGMSLRSDEDNPLFGLVTLSYAIFTALRPLIVDGRDDRQLLRALRAFSIAGAVTLLYLVVDVIRHSTDDGYDPEPGTALWLFSVIWLLVNVAMQWGRVWRRQENAGT